MAAKPHFAASVQSKKGRLYAVMQVKKDGTTKPVWRALGLSEGANKTKVNKAFREVVGPVMSRSSGRNRSGGGRPPADIPVYDYLVSYLKRVEPELQKNTIVSYRSMTNGKIRRYFQRRPQLTVGNLKPQDIQDFYQSLFADGVVANTVIHYPRPACGGLSSRPLRRSESMPTPSTGWDVPKRTSSTGRITPRRSCSPLLHLARGDVIYRPFSGRGHGPAPQRGLGKCGGRGLIGRSAPCCWTPKSWSTGKREKESGAGGGDEEQVQPPHPASPRPGGGDASGAERAPGGVPEDVPRQLQRPIPRLCVRQPAGRAAAPQLCHRPLPGAAGEVRPAAHPLPRPAPHFRQPAHQPGCAADQRVQLPGPLGPLHHRQHLRPPGQGQQAGQRRCDFGHSPGGEPARPAEGRTRNQYRQTNVKGAPLWDALIL